jgi:hypothetical protein
MYVVRQPDGPARTMKTIPHAAGGRRQYPMRPADEDNTPCGRRTTYMSSVQKQSSSSHHQEPSFIRFVGTTCMSSATKAIITKAIININKKKQRNGNVTTSFI